MEKNEGEIMFKIWWKLNKCGNLIVRMTHFEQTRKEEEKNDG